MEIGAVRAWSCQVHHVANRRPPLAFDLDTIKLLMTLFVRSL